MLIAVVGLLLGNIRFKNEQELERKIKIQNQVCTDIDQLLQFTNNESQTLSKVLFLLEDLNSIISYGNYKKENVTTILSEIILNDSDFDNLKHVRFDSITIEHWPDYSEHLKKSPDLHDFIIYKYFQSLRHFHDKEPNYFEFTMPGLSLQCSFIE